MEEDKVYTHPLQHKEVSDYFLNETTVCLYYDVMSLIHGDEHVDLIDVCFEVGLHPVFLWELYILLIGEKCLCDNYDVVNAWMDHFCVEEEDRKKVTDVLADLGGFNDAEVLDNVFIMPLIRFIEEECNMKVEAK